MKAVVFAAGLGTRLKPFTDSHPKALVEVGGEAMLGRVLKKLKRAGVSEVIVNVHHFASQVTDYLRANDNFGLQILVSDESRLLLDTGGALALMARSSGLLRGNDEPVLVHNADIMTDFSLPSFMEAFGRCAGQSKAMLLVDSSRASSRKLLFRRKNMRMCAWLNENSGAMRPPQFKPEDARDCLKAAFGGVHIIAAPMFAAISAYADALRRKNPDADATDGVIPFSITDFYIDNCSSEPIFGYEAEEDYRWFDVGRPESLERARRAFPRP